MGCQKLDQEGKWGLLTALVSLEKHPDVEENEVPDFQQQCKAQAPLCLRDTESNHRNHPATANLCKSLPALEQQKRWRWNGGEEGQEYPEKN